MPQVKTRAEAKQELLDCLKRARDASNQAIENNEKRLTRTVNRTHCDECDCDVGDCKCLCCCDK